MREEAISPINEEKGLLPSEARYRLVVDTNVVVRPSAGIKRPVNPLIRAGGRNSANARVPIRPMLLMMITTGLCCCALHARSRCRTGKKEVPEDCVTSHAFVSRLEKTLD